MALDGPVPETEAVPLEATPLMLQVKVGLSGSVAFRVKLKAVGLLPSEIVSVNGPAPSVITGALPTVTLITMVSVLLPSVTCTVKLSLPL